MITRRSFVVGGVKVAAALPALSLLGRSPACDGERALVVVQLTGGNDGLNTVVTHRQDAYYRLRPTLGLARGSLHPLDDDHGLHPSLRELGGLTEGHPAVQIMADGDADAAALGADGQLRQIEDLAALLHELALFG